jgi:hypothetical protein
LGQLTEFLALIASRQIDFIELVLLIVNVHNFLLVCIRDELGDTLVDRCQMIGIAAFVERGRVCLKLVRVRLNEGFKPRETNRVVLQVQVCFVRVLQIEIILHCNHVGYASDSGAKHVLLLLAARVKVVINCLNVVVERI